MQLAKSKEYVYTIADDEKTPQEKAKAVKRTIRDSKLRTNFDKQDELMSSALSLFQPSTSQAVDSQQLPIVSSPSVSDCEPDVLSMQILNSTSFPLKLHLIHFWRFNLQIVGDVAENDFKSALAPSPVKIPRENSGKS